MNQQNGQKDIVEQWSEFCKMEEEISTKKRTMKEEKENMVIKKQKMMDEITKGMSEKDEEIGKLKMEIRALKMKMAKMEADLKAQDISIHRKMPSELLNELFCSLPLENAYNLLAKMPNGLLARNVQKMIESIKMEMKNNKWNEGDCGAKLTISEDGLAAEHSGPKGNNFVRAIWSIQSSKLAINKPAIILYFEVKIVKKIGAASIAIGFCSQQFPLEDKYSGGGENSIGIGRKLGIMIDGSIADFENNDGYYNDEYFMNGDIVGLGLISLANSSIKLFATCNGKLLGKIKLPSKFANFQIFPAINMYHVGECIRANFGKEEWRFKNFGPLLE